MRRFKPDLVYIDRAHVIEGAIIKGLFSSKIFLRVMGVAVFSYNEILVGKSIFSRISRWSFKSDFTHILFSQDGGDIERFKKRYLYDNVSYSTLFNGVKKKRIK